ncbi:MAG: transposase, partial [Cyanobacteria bacterium REEB67]|nr:transposase [Cyanobacteria bacterium REEB67]MBU6455686.1 transposase [Cyanobacteria bacterium REEB67]
MYESMNILEFQECFGTEKACIDAVYNRRWPAGFICPRC